MNICQSRKNMFSVMSHSGFGTMTIYKNEIKVTIPADLLTKKGKVKCSVVKLINELTNKNVKVLEAKGVICQAM